MSYSDSEDDRASQLPTASHYSFEDPETFLDTKWRLRSGGRTFSLSYNQIVEEVQDTQLREQLLERWAGVRIKTASVHASPNGRPGGGARSTELAAAAQLPAAVANPTAQVRGQFLVFVPTIREIRDFYREM
eukprot:SAG31_NODE_7_length_42755_cov_130.245728_2_plen_132_part_00